MFKLKMDSMVKIDILKIIQTQTPACWTINLEPSGGLNDHEIYCTKMLFFEKKGGQLFATIFFTKST